MQTQHLIFIVTCTAIGLVLMPYVANQVVLRAVAKGVAAKSTYLISNSFEPDSKAIEPSAQGTTL